jgi:hypothetical protein
MGQDRLEELKTEIEQAQAKIVHLLSTPVITREYYQERLGEAVSLIQHMTACIIESELIRHDLLNEKPNTERVSIDKTRYAYELLLADNAEVSVLKDILARVMNRSLSEFSDEECRAIWRIYTRLNPYVTHHR